jgi:ABC-2 type transport system ATP-binding protein
VPPDGPGLSDPAVSIRELRQRFGDREALAGVSLDIRRGEMLALLGPNGSGKTTLFRVLSTAIVPTAGTVTVLGVDVTRHPGAVRRALGVVFQSPGLDRKLTVVENLRHHGRLYGLRGRELEARIAAALRAMGVADRAHERVERLSGGLARRVELAKSQLHRPALLLLDEPTTGLDPAARRDFWGLLEAARAEHGTTLVVTTHLMDEGERGDRVAILDAGALVALGTPAELEDEIGGDVVTITADEPERLAACILEALGERAVIVDGTVRIERARGQELVPVLVDRFPGRIRSIALGKPTLDDVFVRRTGRHLEQAATGTAA